jgi:hypothetical protein
MFVLVVVVAFGGFRWDAKVTSLIDATQEAGKLGQSAHFSAMIWGRDRWLKHQSSRRTGNIVIDDKLWLWRTWIQALPTARGQKRVQAHGQQEGEGECMAVFHPEERKERPVTNSNSSPPPFVLQNCRHGTPRTNTGMKHKDRHVMHQFAGGEKEFL